MKQILAKALSTAAKALAGKDLSSTRLRIDEGVFYVDDKVLDTDASPGDVLLVLKAINPEHDTACLLAAELEVALAIYSKRQRELQRQGLRAKLNAPGDEVEVAR